MLEIARDLGLGDEPLATDRVVHVLGSNLFESDPAMKLPVLGNVNLAQPPLGMPQRT